MAQLPRILIVDNEPEVVRAVRRLLLRRGFEVETADSGQAALQILEATPCDVIIADFKMAGMSGAELLVAVTERFPHVRRVLLSGYADLGLPVDAVFLPKPYDEAQLLGVCHQGRLG